VARPEIVPFADEHLDGAAALLAARHARNRASEPLLPARFDDEAQTRNEIESVWRKEGAAGATASRNGRMVGYLIGAPGNDDVWGANMWIDLAGHAVEDAEVVRDLYASASAEWLERGRSRHYAVVPGTDLALLDAWFRLSFGQQQALGVREVSPESWPAGVRKAEPRDVDALAEIVPLLNRHGLLAPVFTGRRLDFDAGELRNEITQDLADNGIGNLVAERGGRIVGNFEVVSAELSSTHAGLARPSGACCLGFAVTLPEVRGSGVGRALTQACLAWAHEAGYECMVTDWRVTNLLASRFWPRRGFRETFLRLYRSIP
jgi:GNAT superfamily N-acetyltransferase